MDKEMIEKKERRIKEISLSTREFVFDFLVIIC